MERRIIVLATLLPLLFGIFYAPRVSAQPFDPTASTGVVTTGCGSAPCTYTVSSVGGTSFTASITIANVNSLISYDYFFTWNPSVMRLTGVTTGDWSGFNTTRVITNSTTQGTGTLEFLQTLLFGRSVTIGSTPKTLFNVQLQFFAPGSSALNIPPMQPGSTTENPQISVCGGSPCSAFAPVTEAVQFITNANAFSPPFLVTPTPNSLSLA